MASGSVANASFNDIYREIAAGIRIQETTEDAYHYLMVVMPYKAKYAANKGLYESKKFIDKVYKYISEKHKDNILYLVLTREVEATMIHLNVILLTKRPIPIERGCINHDYGYYIQEHDNTVKDKVQTLSYALKEAKERKFQMWLDYKYMSNYASYVPSDTCKSNCMLECCRFNIPKRSLFKRGK